jgi:hypothetical protein
MHTNVHFNFPSGKHLYGVSFVLSRMEYFVMLMTGGWSESSSNIVKISVKDASFSVLELFLKAVHENRLPDESLDEVLAMELADAAEKYLMFEMSEKILWDVMKKVKDMVYGSVLKDTKDLTKLFVKTKTMMAHAAARAKLLSKNNEAYKQIVKDLLMNMFRILYSRETLFDKEFLYSLQAFLLEYRQETVLAMESQTVYAFNSYNGYQIEAYFAYQFMNLTWKDKFVYDGKKFTLRIDRPGEIINSLANICRLCEIKITKSAMFDMSMLNIAGLGAVFAGATDLLV